jgi:hypothetical protein
VLEIRQACATGAGCFATDSPGLPVQITLPGSYRLTSDLTAPDGNTTVISIQSSQVSLDLNGFAIQGPNVFNGVSCSAPGTGIGVSSPPGVFNVAISNGHVRGMGSHGISLVVRNLRIDRIVAEQNCGDGIGGGNHTLVIDSVARFNGGRGITAFVTGQVRNSVADFNRGSGISTQGGHWLIQGCVANLNGVHGIALINNQAHLVTDSLATSNAQHGISVGNNALVLRSSAASNLQSGIAANGSTVGIGFITANANGADVSGAPSLVACIVTGGGQFCP